MMQISEQAVNIVTVISSIFAVIGIFLLVWQIILQRLDRRNEAISRLFDELLTPEFRHKVVFIYSRKPEDLVLSKLTEPERGIVDEVTARFEGLGFKVRKKVIPKKDAIEGFWDWVVRCAQQTQPYIQDQRERRGSSESYRKDFEELARECKLFHLERIGDKTPTKGLSLDKLLQIRPLPIFQVGESSNRDSSPNM